jgi:predicted lipoprotein with Yx(FWY)xxD motif
MHKKTIWIVVVILAVIGGYAIFHKSAPKTIVTSYSSSSNTNTSSGKVVLTETNSTVGTYLADPDDNTLYTHGSGSAGVTSCTGPCLSAWPAYIDKGATVGLPTNIGTITRADNGEVQYTYKGAPLYYFASDSQGQVTGNGVANFYIVKP